MIPKEELVTNGVYSVNCKNFSLATWTGEFFIGTRVDLGQVIESKERHISAVPLGTVEPLVLLFVKE
jgi:hypothetical protein